MDIEIFRKYALQKAGVTEGFPFDNDTLVMKVGNKMFALANLKGDLSINLKYEPEKAIELREKYPAVEPGYHMNKKHWNTVNVDGSIPDKIIKNWIDDSYQLIYDKLPKKIKETINQQ